MRTGAVVVGNKKIDLSKAETLYEDGRFKGSRGVTLYRTPKGTLVWERWTNWQGEDDSYEILTPEEALERLQECHNPDRVAEAIEALGIIRPGRGIGARRPWGRDPPGLQMSPRFVALSFLRGRKSGMI